MSAPPGWQPDPTGRHEHRFWDGTRWTDQVADRGVTSLDPLHAPAPPTGPQHLAPGGGGRSSGLSTGLLVVLAVVVLGLAVGIVVLLTSDGDDDEDTDDGTTTTTTEPATTTTLGPDDPAAQVVEEFATAIHEGSDGTFSLEQARCMAAGILEVIGLERLAEVRIQAGDDVTVNPVDLLTEDEQEAAFDVMRDCVPEGTIQPPSLD